MIEFAADMLPLFEESAARPESPKEELILFVMQLTGMGAVYMLCRLAETIKCLPEKFNRAWVLTMYSSIVMSFAGVSFFKKVVQDGFSAVLEEEETAHTRHLAIFFLAYCVMDLFIGNMEYVEQLDWESGIAHHSVYIGILSYLLWRRQTAFFAVFLVEELPTIYLASKRIFQLSELRWKFAFAYYLTRIVYHSIATYAMLERSTVAFVFSLVILRSHMHWFGRWWTTHGMKQQSKQLGLNQKLLILCSMVAVQIGTHLYVSFRWWEAPTWMSVRDNVLHIGAFCYFAFKMITVLQNTYSDSFIMDAINSRKIIYNISWEDPRIERKKLKFDKNDVILTISSAGDNVLDYLCGDPKHIVAADLNEAQLALLDIKLACIEIGMEYEDFFALFGRSDPIVFDKWYATKIRPNLRREASKTFWDLNGQDTFRGNLMFAGSSGLMAYFLMIVCKIAGLDKNMHRKIPVDPKKSWFIMGAAKIISMPWMWEWLAPLGGVPHEQLSLLSRQPELFSERLIEILSTRMWTKDNYFYHGYITGVFAKDCCPRYMSAEFYPKLKSRVRNVTLWHGLLGDAAKKRKDWTVISLLDSMDWMPFEMVAGLVRDIVPHVDKKRCRIFWRSFAPESEVHSPVLAQLFPDVVPDYDRVGWYLSQWETRVPEKFDVSMIKAESPPTTYVNSIFDDVRVMLSMAMHALRPTKDVATFYRSQGPRYDGFRETLLPDRDTLMQYGIPWTQPIDTWVSVGCGTARDIEFVVDKIKKRKTLKVYLLDLSPALLAIARDRVKRLGLEKRVVLLEGDVTDEAFMRKQPFYGKCDLVTCSYCLTMIPKWKSALEGMQNLLKTGGFLGLVDFTMRYRRETTLVQRFYRRWFKSDGVYFDRAHVDWLKSNTKQVWYYENSARVPYTVLYPTHYVYVGRKASSRGGKRKAL